MAPLSMNATSTSGRRCVAVAAKPSTIRTAAQKSATPAQVLQTAAPLAAASVFATNAAQAANEVATVAGDSRVGIIATLFLPLVGWVLFNIGGPAISQYQQMRQGNRLGPGGPQLQAMQGGGGSTFGGGFPGTTAKMSVAPNSQKKRLGKSDVPQRVKRSKSKK